MVKSKKLQVYGIILLEWLFVAAAWYLCRRHHLSLSDIGECWGNSARTIVSAIVLVFLFAVLTILDMRPLHQRNQQSLKRKLRSLNVLPATAGMLYRDWLVKFFAAEIGSIVMALICCAVMFGIGHTYQGMDGVIQTNIMGPILGAVFSIRQGFTAGQLSHFTIDAVNGLIGVYALSLYSSGNH